MAVLPSSPLTNYVPVVGSVSSVRNQISYQF